MPIKHIYTIIIALFPYWLIADTSLEAAEIFSQNYQNENVYVIALSIKPEAINLNGQEIPKDEREEKEVFSKKGSLLDISSNSVINYFSDARKISSFSGLIATKDMEYKSIEWSVLYIKDSYHAWRFGFSLFQDEDRLTEDENDHTTMLSVFGAAYFHANTPYVNPFIGIGAVAGLNVCTFIEAGLEGSINAATNNSQIQQPDGSYEPLDIQLCPTDTVFALYQELGFAIDIAGVQVFPFVRKYFDGDNYHGELSYGIGISTSIFFKK